ncbi:UbiA prenyltransferase family protein [Candidatus Gottesmanbacteria bacterium]|nr:UbiA prenyltransferase family protein [Candidatus Gottesmanbacteria bacterium]
MMKIKTLFPLPPLLLALRPNQWVKNFILFAAIIFTGKLFDPRFFIMTFLGFLIFCAISSASYLFNDIIDLKFDKLHPDKKTRPLAAGLISLSLASEAAFLLGFFGLIAALLLSTVFFFVAAAFAIIHILYSTVLKKHAILDIMGIAFSFILRAYAGEAITGYHLPFWLFLAVMFVALFVAATKRHSELIREGTTTRPVLFQYREHLLDFYNSMFGSAAILAYAMFTFWEEPSHFNPPFRTFLFNTVPQAIERKWMIITIPFVIYGLMRYAQLAYEGTQGERPEKIITTDLPLIVSILMWGLLIIMFLYIL